MSITYVYIKRERDLNIYIYIYTVACVVVGGMLGYLFVRTFYTVRTTHIADTLNGIIT